MPNSSPQAGVAATTAVRSRARRNWWSNASVGHSCAAPIGKTGELELYCHDREYGITELNEPIMAISHDGFFTAGNGPWLTPYLDTAVPGIRELFRIPNRVGQAAVPIPIVVTGRFDDPRAKDCRPDAIDLCRHRLVLEQIVRFGA